MLYILLLVKIRKMCMKMITITTTTRRQGEANADSNHCRIDLSQQQEIKTICRLKLKRYLIDAKLTDNRVYRTYFNYLSG